ncbi:hypothetical protein PybrP1_001678 [[Pythium] brassicae (nom. inval.)]|nr:hypothetical protein PybrP1_001678 [[Pythium] brassicae (nom. inval.)]
MSNKGVVLIEGNYIVSTATPNMKDTTSAMFVLSSSNHALCTAQIGRDSVARTLVSSNTLAGRSKSTVMSAHEGVRADEVGGPDGVAKATEARNQRWSRLACLRLRPMTRQSKISSTCEAV